MMEMRSKTTLALNELSIDLGKEGAISYVRFSLPQLIERHDELTQLLIQKKWSEASSLAHKMLGSIRVFGETSFESQVKGIEAQTIEKIDQPDFQQTFQKSFQQLLASIESWLGASKQK